VNVYGMLSFERTVLKWTLKKLILIMSAELNWLRMASNCEILQRGFHNNYHITYLYCMKPEISLIHVAIFSIFICILLDDTVSNSDYIASNDLMVLNCKGCGQ
jgi:hypothetical protein